jgi:nucleotide-binding universal stress UspA family protein
MLFMVCYDGTLTGRRAVKLAQKHAAKWKAKMVIVKAVERETPLKRVYIEEEEQRLKVDISTLLQDSTTSWNCELFISSLSSGEQVEKFARSEHVDLVFIGVEKRSKVGKLLFGSTAQHVILHSPCPVVTVNSPEDS